MTPVAVNRALYAPLMPVRSSHIATVRMSVYSTDHAPHVVEVSLSHADYSWWAEQRSDRYETAPDPFCTAFHLIDIAIAKYNVDTPGV